MLCDTRQRPTHVKGQSLGKQQKNDYKLVYNNRDRSCKKSTDVNLTLIWDSNPILC